MKRPEDSMAEAITRDWGMIPGKALLRRNEFLERRGLTRESRNLLLGSAGLKAAQESANSHGLREKTALLDESPPDPNVVWRSLGPAGIPDCQTYGGGTATMSGRVTAVAVDPNDSEHLLIGTAAGGVWQTRDGGGSWEPQTDDMPTLSIGALAFDSSDPTRVYAGTGEGNSQYARYGMGILVSLDGGSTWTGPVGGDMFTGIGFYGLVVDPRDGRRLIIATTGGAAVTPDAGSQWSLFYPGTVWDVSLAYRGDEPEILLGTPEGLFAIRRGRVPAPVAVPGLSSLDRNQERMAVAHVPSDPGQAFIFAASQGHARLWHRPAADQPFVPVALPLFGVPALPSFGVPNWSEDVLDVTQAAYDWHVSVPPGRDDTIYLGAKELVKGERTGDGWNWSDISSRPGRGDSIHPDQHAMAFDPQHPDIIYAGNDGGIFRSLDAGSSWQSLNTGLSINEVEYLAQRPDDPVWILAGLQDNGTVRRESRDQWAQVAQGDGGDCGVNSAHPDICFHSFNFMGMERSRCRGEPGTWEDVSPPESTVQLIYPPLEVNGDIVAKAGQIVYVSADSAANWVGWCLPKPTNKIYANLGNPSKASALAIPTQDQVLVGTVQGDVFRIDLAGDISTALTTLTSPQAGCISDLLVDPHRPERYWATFSSRATSTPDSSYASVFRSEDRGTTWMDATANLPSLPINAVVLDPAESDRVWVACDAGVYESRDAGGRWAKFGTGLPNAIAADLTFYEPDRLLRVGTRSRGIWEVTIG
jgi:photosystem II stability/assembly factor-like uncharacterized protein